MCHTDLGYISFDCRKRFFFRLRTFDSSKYYKPFLYIYIKKRSRFKKIRATTIKNVRHHAALAFNFFFFLHDTDLNNTTVRWNHWVCRETSAGSKLWYRDESAARLGKRQFKPAILIGFIPPYVSHQQSEVRNNMRLV